MLTRDLNSNHGGRQLDDSPATIDALPECVKAAEGKIRVHVDGGIRSGADVLQSNSFRSRVLLDWKACDLGSGGKTCLITTI